MSNSFNADAQEWKPSAAAVSWTPGGGFTPPAAAAAAAPPPPPVDNDNNDDGGDVDPNDPLWQAVLKICGGDTEKALKMIDDPDSLTQYPEIVALLNSASGSNEEQDDWEAQDEDEKVVSDKMTTLSVSEPETAPPTTTKALAAPKTVAPKKKEAAEEEDQDNNNVVVVEGDPREHLNLVFIGHVDAGKSTLSGNILYLTDNVDQRTIEKYGREAKDRNRESWFLAFIMDTNEEERAKGKTVEVGRAQFDTPEKRFTILDAPGHKNYVPNMIMGASQADVGVLVISARKGEFETGFERGGQTREHAMLAKTLGVSYLLVVINKMDDPTVLWAKERFDECVNKIRPFLKGCGYTIKREVKFIPISGLSGANVKDVVSPTDCPWWSKSVAKAENNTDVPTLIGLMNSLEMKGRNPDAPVRVPVLDRYTDRGTIAMGKVEAGTLKPGLHVTVMPTRQRFKIDAIWANETPVSAARPGENVLIKLAQCGTEDILKGFVICTDPPCRAVDKIICLISLLDMPDNVKIFTSGFTCMFHSHCCEEEAKITKIFETTNAKGLVNKSAMFATVGMRVVCMVELARTVPVETFEDKPFLGRLTLRTEGKTVAIGKIIKLPPKKT